MESQWMHSPVSGKTEGLRPGREIWLEPYQGRRRRYSLFHTHYLIGSDPECDIRLDDPFVCPEHAELVIDRGGSSYSIVDLGSKNGVILNGVKVRTAPLPKVGTLRLGRSSLRWVFEENELEVEDGWIVADPAMKEILKRVKRAAVAELPILLLGETGTGKEILAQIIHRASHRARYPYVAMNGALTGGNLAESELFGHSRGAFTGADSARLGALRMAKGGTLFLDEVADIPAAAQVKLLRALESGEVRPLGTDIEEKTDFRLVSATSQDLDRKIAEGHFRLDLYYRLAGFVVHIPPLRERPLDIVALAKHFLAAEGLMLAAEAEAALLSYSWPGNVRELRSCLSRAILVAKETGSSFVSADCIMGLDRIAFPGKGRVLTLEEAEREMILSSLERNGWLKGVSARELGIARSTLFQKMRRYSIRDAAGLD